MTKKESISINDIKQIMCKIVLCRFFYYLQYKKLCLKKYKTVKVKSIMKNNENHFISRCKPQFSVRKIVSISHG